MEQPPPPADVEVAIRRLQKDIEILSKMPSKDYPVSSLQKVMDWLKKVGI